MKTSYLDYYKTVLDKVSFSHQLLKKEYRKALGILKPEEKVYLNNWMKDRGLAVENAATTATGYQSSRRSVAA